MTPKKTKVDFKKVEDIMSFQGRKRIWLSHILGVPQETVSYWFNGKREIQSHYIAPLSVALGVPLKFITK